MNTIEEVFSHCYKYYPTIYSTRVDVIDHLFFVIGNGYKWKNGCPVEASDEYRPKPVEAERPLPDDGALRRFYPVSRRYSAVFTVPDDVKPDWLALAYEAAIMLRDRSERTGKRNIELGIEAVAELERRFPQLVSR